VIAASESGRALLLPAFCDIQEVAASRRLRAGEVSRGRVLRAMRFECVGAAGR
jgi:hypothetical protein